MSRGKVAYLGALAAHLNEMAQIPDHASERAQYVHFTAQMRKFVTAAPPVALRKTSRPQRLQLRCTDPRYADVLTGRARSSPLPIVDFVPLGYELDMLEVRLLENYEHVDAFVVYEAPVTQRGLPKPLFFNESLVLEPQRHQH